MKKNNKGFMLAEVVVTATILLTIMVGLFFTFNKIYARYNKLTTYKNIDGMYLLDNLTEYLLNTQKEDRINKLLQTYPNTGYLFIIKNKTCQDQIKNSEYCNELKETYNIENLIMIKEDETVVNSLKTTIESEPTHNNTLIDYLEYITKYYAFDNNAKNSYIFIAEYITNENEEENTYNYSSIELR